MFKILVSDPLAQEGVDILKKVKEFQVDVKHKLPPEELKKIIKDYDALLVRSETKVTKEIIEAATNEQLETQTLHHGTIFPKFGQKVYPLQKMSTVGKDAHVHMEAYNRKLYASDLIYRANAKKDFLTLYNLVR